MRINPHYFVFFNSSLSPILNILYQFFRNLLSECMTVQWMGLKRVSWHQEKRWRLNFLINWIEFILYIIHDGFIVSVYHISYLYFFLFHFPFLLEFFFVIIADSYRVALDNLVIFSINRFFRNLKFT